MRRRRASVCAFSPYLAEGELGREELAQALDGAEIDEEALASFRHAYDMRVLLEREVAFMMEIAGGV